MSEQIIITPNGERLVVLPEAEFLAMREALEDREDAEAVRAFERKLATGEEELIPAKLVNRILDGESKVRVWRSYRGMSARDLAAATGLSAPYISEIESRKTVGAPLPRIAEAMPLEGRKVRVTFDDGNTKVVDLSPALTSRRVYIPLREDDELFRGLRVSEDRNAIEWDGGLDFSAIWLEALPPVDFDNVAFRKAMDDLDLSLDGMAAQLEISRRLVADYRKSKPIPRHIALATRYLLEHQTGAKP